MSFGELGCSLCSEAPPEAACPHPPHDCDVRPPSFPGHHAHGLPSPRGSVLSPADVPRAIGWDGVFVLWPERGRVTLPVEETLCNPGIVSCWMLPVTTAEDTARGRLEGQGMLSRQRIPFNPNT